MISPIKFKCLVDNEWRTLPDGDFSIVFHDDQVPLMQVWSGDGVIDEIEIQRVFVDDGSEKEGVDYPC